MIAYRRKTKSDETLDPSMFYRGRQVFVDGPNGREERICVGAHLSPVTIEEYRRLKRGTPQKSQTIESFSEPAQENFGLLVR